MFDVTPHGEDADIVDVKEIVSQVEFGEPEGDFELRYVCGLARSAEEGECEVWPAVRVSEGYCLNGMGGVHV